MSYKVGRKYRDHFLELLSSPVFSIPKGGQWVVIFEELAEYILPGIKLALSYDTALRTNNKWAIERATKAVMGEDYQKTAGCVFCHGIVLPGESVTVQSYGPEHGAFMRSYVVDKRDSFPQMKMTFLDTHVSFADNFLRPWAVSTATFGMIGRRRTEEKNYRTNVHCYKFGSTKPNKPPEELEHWTFFDVCCISVSQEEYNYNPSTSPTLREANFIYNSYSLDTEKNPFNTLQREIIKGTPR
jgi:hypothetical protein